MKKKQPRLFWAVRMGDWVEIRESPKPLREKVTKVIVETTERTLSRYERDPITGHFQLALGGPRKVDRVLKTVVYTGGRHVKHVPYLEFKKKAKARIFVGEGAQSGLLGLTALQAKRLGLEAEE